jgi:simple sugar transport system permease protein
MTDPAEVATTPSPEVTPPSSGWSSRVAGLGLSTRQAMVLPTLAFLSALIVGGLIIALTDLDALGRLGSEPGAALADMFNGIAQAYRALVIGAVGSVRAVSESLFAATPLIFAGLGVALGFRAGLFNIGAQGQIQMGAMAAVLVGLYVTVPGPLHIPLTLLAGLIGGTIWGGIPGLLKARTGAHEVITTIMLNFVALYLMQWLLTIPLIQQPGRENPVSKPLAESAHLPLLFGSPYRVTIAFLIAVGAVFVVRWLVFRSSFGFELRATGFNQQAARYAGMNVAMLTVLAMAISGAMAGITGANQIMALPPYDASPALAGTVGFDAITVALLGRSHPVGVLWAALLFGALKAGGRTMQAQAGVPLDLIVVLQALIVMFVAAPELVRAIYRIKAQRARPAAQGGGA